MIITVKCSTCGKKKKISSAIVRNNHYCNRKCYLKSKNHYALLRG